MRRKETESTATRFIIGVEFPSLGLSTLQTMFADNLSLIIRAVMIYVVRCRQILMTFGAASGLLFLWEQTVAAFIPEGPPPMEFRPLLWKWENSTDASPLLGFPVAASFSVDLMENQVLATIDSCLAKLRGKHLALAARITVANGLILSSIWYIMVLWAGDFSFFQIIQRKLEAFVWGGRHRVDRNTLSQSRSRGGLGLISVADQYRAMAGNLMVWVLGPGEHPLRLILRSHIQDLSKRKWGIADLSWIVSKGGSSESSGSPSWKSICKAWGSLKPLLRHAIPRNTEEWRELPLWRPHVHHISESRVKCTTQAQQRLYQAGILTNGDISTEEGHFKLWEDLPVDIEDTAGRRAYEALVANIRPPAPFDPQPGPHRVYYGEEMSAIQGKIWLFDVQQHSVSSSWPNTREAALPISTFQSSRGNIKKIARDCPQQSALLHRVLVRHSQRKGNKRSHFGLWSTERNVLLQSKWSDGSPLLDTTTAQLRTLQGLQRLKPHTASARWERDLGCAIPVQIWQET